MTIGEWIGAIIFCGLGIIIIIGNWGILADWLIRKKSGSTIPFIGGIMLMMGLCLFTPLRTLCWLGLIIDYGFWTGIFGLPLLIKEFFAETFNKHK